MKRSEYIVFTNVDEKAFNEYFSVKDNAKWFSDWDIYNSSHGLLVAKMYSEAHQDAVYNFTNLIRDKLAPMGLKNFLQGTGRHGTRKGNQPR